MRRAITPQTAAILIEPIQGESGITIATPEYLLGLRKLCDERNLLLLFDEVQAGHFRTGKFQSWQRILENRPADFLPDGVSMAKSLGGGFPIGAFWVREKFAKVLSPGTHASTFGGTPLACAVALKILEVIEREDLADKCATHRRFSHELSCKRWQRNYPKVLRAVRGFGLMIGLEFEPKLPGFRGGGEIARNSSGESLAQSWRSHCSGGDIGRSLVAGVESKAKRSGRRIARD